MKYIKSIGIALLAMIAVFSASAQNFQDGLVNVATNIIGGPWAVGGGFEHSTSGTGANVAFATVTYNLTPNIGGSSFSSGPIVGYDDCMISGKTLINSLSGGWSLSSSGHWFSFVGKTFVTNIVGTITGYQLIATPRGGGPVGAITGGSVSIDVGPVYNFHLKPTLVYNGRNGQAGFDGNFIGGALFISHDF
jgi:hypothetical protein